MLSSKLFNQVKQRFDCHKIKMKTNKKSISNRKIKFLIIVASLIMIERSFMVSGIQAVPEQYLPPKLKKYQSIIRRVHLTLGLLSLVSWLCSMACFVLFKAKTFNDYSEVATFFVGVLFLITFHTSFVWQSSEVSGILTDLKNTVEQSGLKMESIIN